MRRLSWNFVNMAHRVINNACSRDSPATRGPACVADRTKPVPCLRQASLTLLDGKTAEDEDGEELIPSVAHKPTPAFCHYEEPFFLVGLVTKLGSEK